jgi:hypothetical protein
LTDADWLEDVWLDARNYASKETGIEFDNFPGICHWKIEDVLQEDWLPGVPSQSEVETRPQQHRNF